MGISICSCFRTEELFDKFSWKVGPYILLSLPNPKGQGTVCTHVHFRLTLRKLAIFRNIGVQFNYIHNVDFPLLVSVICFSGLGSPPVQGIPNINWRVLKIRARSLLILKARSFEQECFKIAHPRSKQFITCISIFSASLSFTHTCSTMFLLGCLWGFVDLAYRDTHAKITKLLKDLRLCTISLKLHIWYPKQLYLPSTESLTRYRIRHFLNNFTTIEDIVTKFEAHIPHCLRLSKKRTYSCSNFVAISSFLLELLKECPFC